MTDSNKVIEWELEKIQEYKDNFSIIKICKIQQKPDSLYIERRKMILEESAPDKINRLIPSVEKRFIVDDINFYAYPNENMRLTYLCIIRDKTKYPINFNLLKDILGDVMPKDRFSWDKSLEEHMNNFKMSIRHF